MNSNSNDPKEQIASLKTKVHVTSHTYDSITNSHSPVIMSYFRITLMRSGIGLPKRTQGVLKALGLRTRMKTVFFPVTPEVAGQIMKVKELVAVQEVDKAMTKEELRDERRPDAGYYIESAVPR